jgi:hypothetical protein
VITPLAHSPQALFIRRLEELFDLWQDVFSDFLQFVSVFHLANFFGDGAANVFASGNCGRGNRVGTLETRAYRSQVSTAGAAKLTRLFVGTAAWTKHS